MAWRIDESVIRGEIDNCTHGRVTGRIWFSGRAEPVELDLIGNAWRDLAGRRLEFINPEPKSAEAGMIARLASRQLGVIGDCTASRKVKIPDVPLDQIGEYYAARKPFPWHWGNSLYLEWFSPTNGRVVIETASFQLKIGEEIAWEMSAGEEETQRRTNAAETERFFAQLGGATSAEIVDDMPEAWGENVDEADDSDSDDYDPDAPLTEEAADQMLENSDRLADRINARVEREGIENYEKIVEEEVERRRIERGEKSLTPEEEAKRAEWIAEMNRAAEEALNDPKADLEDEPADHPLVERVSDLAVTWLRTAEARNWIPPDASEEHPVADLVTATMTAGVKLAGALNGSEWPPEREFCGHAIARLKRAHGHLEHARLAAESCVEQALSDAAWLVEVQRELGEILRECDVLITELRARLERGFD